MDYPRIYFYSQNHIWIEIGKSEACIGITDYIQNYLGEILVVDIFGEGKQLKQGDSFGRIESVTKSLELIMPVGGIISEVNKSVVSNPEILNRMSYFQGWIVKVKVDNLKETDNLLLSWKYEKLIKTVRK